MALAKLVVPYLLIIQVCQAQEFNLSSGSDLAVPSTADLLRGSSTPLEMPSMPGLSGGSLLDDASPLTSDVRLAQAAAVMPTGGFSESASSVLSTVPTLPRQSQAWSPAKVVAIAGLVVLIFGSVVTLWARADSEY